VRAYEVEISANRDFLPGFYFFNLGAGTFTASQSTGSSSQEGVNYWRVRTLDNANNFSPWSEVRKFTVGAPTWTNFAASGLTPQAVTGGGTIQGVVHIQNAAPAGGQVYTLTSSNPSAATVPASVTVPAGASSASFTVTTRAVSVSTPVMLTVWSEGNGEHPVLWVDPGAPPPPGTVTLSSLAISPASVAGGASASGTVTLTGAAAAGGATVGLSSSSGAATVPGSVTVAAGSTTATFSITTSSVTTSTPATITASFGGVSRTATLTVTPPAPPATPTAPSLISPANGASVPLPITFDWSDVTAAASYLIQIDDSSTFSAPRVVEQTVAASQLTVTSLAARQHWWRVRGINSAGTAGAWSSVRSFTPQGAAPPPGQPATLTVTATGRSGERVTSSPAGINVAVGSSGSASFNTGTSITLSVSNGRDAIWSGACSSGGNKTRTCTFTLTAAATVTANVQ